MTGSTSPRRGAFIVLEGMDRSGKTTQATRLHNNLQAQGHKAISLRFPDRTTPIGSMIDSYLRGTSNLEDHAIHLLFAANRWEKADYIRQTIASGITIICDRYYLSGVCYTTAKENPDCSYGWAYSAEVGLPKPDLTLFLDLKPEIAEARGGFGEERYERREMQARVRTLFSAHKDVNTIINAAGTVDNVELSVREAVDSIMRSMKIGSLRDLGKIEKLQEEECY